MRAGAAAALRIILQEVWSALCGKLFLGRRAFHTCRKTFSPVGRREGLSGRGAFHTCTRVVDRELDPNTGLHHAYL